MHLEIVKRPILRSTLVGLVVMTVSSVSVAQQACPGCDATASAPSTDTGAGLESISVSVEVFSGKCTYKKDVPTETLRCLEENKCKILVTRSWSGFPANDPNGLQFCFANINGAYCRSRSTGSGQGTSTLDPIYLSCGEEPITYAIAAVVSNDFLYASVLVTCAGCPF